MDFEQRDVTCSRCGKQYSMKVPVGTFYEVVCADCARPNPRSTPSNTDWKCDLCGRKQGGDSQPPQGWLSLNIPDRFTGAVDERVLCGYCVDVVRAGNRVISSDSNWIEKSLDSLQARGVIGTTGRQEVRESFVYGYAAHLAKLDTSGLADRIATTATETINKLFQGEESVDVAEAIAPILAPLLEQRKKDEAEIEELMKDLELLRRSDLVIDENKTLKKWVGVLQHRLKEANQRFMREAQRNAELKGEQRQMVKVLRECRTMFNAQATGLMLFGEEVSGGVAKRMFEQVSRIDTILAALAGEVGDETRKDSTP